MSISLLLPGVGKVNSLVMGIPVFGEMLVRASSRFVGTLAFRTPLIGGKPSDHIGQVMEQWLKFLGFVGIHPRVIEVSDGFFEVELDRCPLGFNNVSHRDTCDACMDLDRIYVHCLGGRLELLDRISYGDNRCRLRVSFIGSGKPS